MREADIVREAGSERIDDGKVDEMKGIDGGLKDEIVGGREGGAARRRREVVGSNWKRAPPPANVAATSSWH